VTTASARSRTGTAVQSGVRKLHREAGPEKFLLGTDRRAAERANARLELLWQDVVAQSHKNNTEGPWAYQQWLESGLSIPGEPIPRNMAQREPLWTEELLELAEAIRNGQNYINVPFLPYDGVQDKHYVQ
jgi:hypothetical protein